MNGVAFLLLLHGYCQDYLIYFSTFVKNMIYFVSSSVIKASYTPWYTYGNNPLDNFMQLFQNVELFDTTFRNVSRVVVSANNYYISLPFSPSLRIFMDSITVITTRLIS